MRKETRVILAPSNLGLRPQSAVHHPGTWRAPAALVDAGLLDAVRPAVIDAMARPPYDPEQPPGGALLNGPALRAFNLELAERVEAAVAAQVFTLVVGGDCSILTGALAGAGRQGPLALVHIDGHSDFRHPGNTAPDQAIWAAAGMDLALATGRGERDGIEWPGAPCPLTPDHRVVQLGEREGRDADYPWSDIVATDIHRIDVFEARSIGTEAVIKRIFSVLNREKSPFWAHFDVDVMDQVVMPAVDSPGSPGLDPDMLVQTLSGLIADPRCLGMTVTVYDPDLDPDGRCAEVIVDIISRLPFPGRG